VLGRLLRAGVRRPLEFVQAVIDVESAWHPYVLSAKGAAGPMQLTVPTAFTFGVTNRFLIGENIRAELHALRI